MHENEQDSPKLVVIISPSGAGKRVAIGILEDLFQYGAITKVLPTNLVLLVRDVAMLPFWKKLAVHLAMQEFRPEHFVRDADAYIDQCLTALKQLHGTVPDVKILFLYCAQSELANRQSYGFHPLKNACGTLRAAIFKESEILLQLFQRLAKHFDHHNLGFIDTSGPKQVAEFRKDLEEQLFPHSGPLTIRTNQPDAEFVTRGWNNMHTTLRQIERVAKALQESTARAQDAKLNCLLIGETGTGKEHIANMLHAGDIKTHPFQVLDCTSIPPSLLESELWGVGRGAFTGAIQRDGLVAGAANGTLFLDEIGLTDKTFQAKLLRFIETRTYRRLGETKEQHVKGCQIIAATSRNLEEEARSGAFLPDLFYRIAAITITIPALRERREDIPLLVDRFSSAHGITFRGDALAILMDYDWPGNVRELKQVVDRCAILGDTRNITPADLPSRITKSYVGITEFEDRIKDFPLIHDDNSPAAANDEPRTTMPHAHDWDTDRRGEILRALAEAGGNRSKAADALGTERTKFYRELKEYGIEQ